jgi:hypothetical protein
MFDELNLHMLALAHRQLADALPMAIERDDTFVYTESALAMARHDMKEVCIFG